MIAKRAVEQTNDLIDDADYNVLHRNTGIDSRRLANLSDAIYAVAMTLLVLDLKPPTHASDSHLTAALRTLSPHFLTYLLSFLTLGVLWTAHLIQSHWLERTSRAYIWMKIVFLMFIVLIPFSTEILATYSHETLGVVIYGLNYFICMLLLLLLWIYATNGRRLVRHNLSLHVITWVKARLVVANIFAVAALLIAIFISTRVGAILFIVAQILVSMPTASIDKIISWAGFRSYNLLKSTGPDDK
jgi:uncharacterized membrane protein